MTAHCSWAGRPGPTTFPPTTADGARASGRRDRKSTRLNSSHSQISYAVSLDQKSTRLNSSHSQISYAVFCLQKKTQLHRLSTRVGHADIERAEALLYLGEHPAHVVHARHCVL